MRRWKPQLTNRVWMSAAIMALAFIAALALLIPVGQSLLGPPETWPINGELFLRSLAGMAALSVAGYLIYRVAAALSLSYAMDRNGLYIHWLGNRAIVPIQTITSIESGLSDPAAAGPPLAQIGYFHGQYALPEGRTLHRFSTLAPAQALIINTTTDAYAIAPLETDAFVQELEQRRRLGPIQQLSAGVETGRAFFYAFWHDRVVRMALLVAVCLNLILLGWLAFSYPGLPPVIELRADAVGEVMLATPRHQILFLPLAALMVGLLNLGLGMTLYGRERAGAQLLQLASAGLQIFFVVAVLTILV
ncbi:MAG: PH domain-containing protein [Oscillochloridaceae bacterium umkhey_bin13]